MGIETVLFAAFVGLQAVSQIQAGQKKAEAAVVSAEAEAASLREEGELTKSERAKALRLKSARQVSSFLTSGLSLEGTPSDVLSETFETGIADIRNIGKNFQTSIDNRIRQGNAQSSQFISESRTQAIGTIASGFSGVGGGSLFDTNAPLGSQGTVSRTIEFGSPSAQGPIQGFGGLG